jgi:hypothetical protein
MWGKKYVRISSFGNLVRLVLGEGEEMCSQMEYEVCLWNVVNAARLKFVSVVG